MSLTIAKRLKWRIARLKTLGFRSLLTDQGDEWRLRRRIHQRIKELGRWYEDGNSDLMGYSYHPIPFDGFEGIKAHRGTCEERLQAILKELKIEKGDWILDIGANVGFFAFGLEREGAFVEAYEPHSPTFEIGAALSKLYRRNVLYINKAFGTPTLNFLKPHYKAVLLLSVFHWLIKQEGEAQAVHVLRELAKRSDYLFFEAPSDPEDGMTKNRHFVSRDSVEAYLGATLPDKKAILLTQDGNWGKRYLYKIDCTGA